MFNIYLEERIASLQEFDISKEKISYDFTFVPYRARLNSIKQISSCFQNSTYSVSEFGVYKGDTAKYISSYIFQKVNFTL